jgi:hypothetical protein
MTLQENNESPRLPTAPSTSSGAGGGGTPPGAKLAIILLAATIVGLITWALAHGAGASVLSAAITGGAAFGGAFGLGLAVVKYLEAHRNP